MIGRGGRQAGERLFEVDPGVHVSEFARRGEGAEGGEGAAAPVRSEKNPILATQAERLQSPLGHVVVDAGITVTGTNVGVAGRAARSPSRRRSSFRQK